MNFALLSIASISILAATGCSHWPFSHSPEVPLRSSSLVSSAEGTVSYDLVDDNKNTKVTVDVKHLAEASRIDPSSSVYVVWVKPTNRERAENMGALVVDSNLEGKLTTITPYKSFDIFVTPEKTPTASTPSGARVLSADILEQHS